MKKGQAFRVGIFLPMIFLIVIGGTYIYLEPKDDLTWCKRNMPQFNATHIDDRIGYCYGEGWSEYCKISYPYDCPNNEDPYKSCLQKCAMANLGSDCPC